jgi:hypothetical protein
MGKTRNIRIVAIIPGPRQPTDIAPYFLQLCYDFLNLGKNGIEVKDSAKGEPYKHRPFLAHVLADSPARTKLSRWLGVGAYLACGWCLFQGTPCKKAIPNACPDGAPKSHTTIYYKGYAGPVRHDVGTSEKTA